MKVDRLYAALLADILACGSRRDDRTGTGTRAVFGRTLDFDVRDEFPLLGLRRLSFRVVALELQWMLRGITDPQWMAQRDMHLWDPWMTEDAGIGPTIGQQWRAWPVRPGGRGDQLTLLLDGLRHRPHSRRHLLSAWNVADLPDETLSPQENARQGRMALAPCLVTQQFFAEGQQLSLMVNQRSADAYLGLPIDIAGSALLLHLVARFVGRVPHRLVMCLGDAHLYLNHLEQAQALLRREPRPAPRLVFHVPPKRPDDYEEGEIEIEGYAPHPALKAPISA
jgi:thymidylate synthase